jgi:predicted permease
VQAGSEPTASYRVVTPGYFAAVGIPLLSGRDVTASDRADGTAVVVVSRALADQAWPGRDPIGRRITFDPLDRRAPWYTVVGIVGDVHSSSLEHTPEPSGYVSFAQANFGHFGDWGMDIVVRTAGDPSPTVAAARRVLRAIAPTIPLYDARPLSELIAGDLARRRAMMVLLVGLATIVMALLCLGLYGIVALGVARRRAEFGLRMALGAEPGSVWLSVLVRGLSLAGVGLMIGLPSAALVSRMLQGLLYGTQPIDSVTFAGVAVTLLAIAAAASFLPAYRGARVDPMEALRSQ